MLHDPHTSASIEVESDDGSNPTRDTSNLASDLTYSGPDGAFSLMAFDDDEARTPHILTGGLNATAARLNTQLSVNKWLSAAAKWDWYGVSVVFPKGLHPSDDDRDAVRVCVDLGLEAIREPKPGQYGYRAAIGFGLRGERKPRLDVMGCSDRNRGSFFQIKGGNPALCEALRTHPAIIGAVKATVARADVAVDLLLAPGVGFDELEKLARATGDARLKVKVTISETGRTLYIGVRGSLWMMRIYEKGLQRRADGVDADPGWVRIEVEFHPKSREKQGFLALSPVEALCLHRWVRAYFEKLAGLLGAKDGERLEPTEVEESPGNVPTVENSAEWALKQTSRTFIRYGLIYCDDDAELETLKEEVVKGHGGEEAARRYMARAAYLAATKLAKEDVDQNGEIVVGRRGMAHTLRREENLLETSRDAEAQAKALRLFAETEARKDNDARSYYSWVQDLSWTNSLRGAIDGSAISTVRAGAWIVTLTAANK